MTYATPQKVLFRCAPEPGESLYGFVARVAAANQLNNAYPLLKAAGVSHGPGRLIGDFGPKEASALASVMRVAPEDLEAMYSSQSLNRVNLEGIEVKTSMFYPYRRVAPAALRKSAFHRRSWQMRQMPYCPETWDVLIENCPSCKAPLTWTPTPGIEFCQRCCVDLRQATTVQVDEADREPLAALSGLMSSDRAERDACRSRLSPAVMELGTGDLLQLATIMGAAMLPPGARDLFANKPKRCRSVADGARRLLDPEGPFSIWLHHSNAAQPEPVLRTRRDVMIGGSPELRAFVDRSLGDRHGIRRLRDLRQREHLLTLTDAAATLKLERGILRRVIDTAFPLKANPRGSERRSQWIEPSELELLRQRLNNSVSEAAFAREFGLDATAVEQLKRAELLDENYDAAVSVAYEAPALTAQSVDRFREQLQTRLSSCRSAEPDWLPIRAALLAVGARQKPWAVLVRGIFDGSIPAARPPSETRNVIGDLLVPKHWEMLPPKEARSCEALSRTISRCEAERHLNCYPRDLSQVRRADWQVEEDVGQGLRREIVEAFGREHISMREIVARTGVAAAEATPILRQNGLEHTHGAFWSRKDVEDLLQPRTDPSSKRGLEEFTPVAIHSFGVRTANLRRKAGMSRHTIEEVSGIDRHVLATIEAGDRAVQVSTIDALAGALMCNRTDLAHKHARAKALNELLLRLAATEVSNTGEVGSSGH